MNVKHYGIKIFNLLFFTGILFHVELAAQVYVDDSLSKNTGTYSLRNFEFIKQSDARITGENPAGLQYMPAGRIAFAETYFSKNNGNFVNFNQSDDAYEIGALTESFFRLNSNTVLYGKVNYSNFRGKRMGGSVFINPYEQVFDIVETVDSTKGEKNLENYNLAGAVSVQLNDRLALGGRIDYRAANYAKFKDLRHSNKLFDLSLKAGLSYAFTDFLEAGLNYFYRRSVEGLVFKMYGTTDRQYISLVSFGSFYGRNELFGEDGYTDPDHSNPSVNEWNGASLQITYCNNFMFFNELSYRLRKGYFGKKSPGTPVYLEHKTPIWSYTGTLSLRNRGNQHIIEINAGKENSKNYENIYRIENTPGGRTEVIYLGNNKRLERNILNARLKYSVNMFGHNSRQNYLPHTSLQAEINGFSRKQTVSLYPYFRKQTVNSANIQASAERHLFCIQNNFSVLLGLSYGFGNGTDKADGVYATPSGSQQAPRNHEVYLTKEYEYLTSSRAGGKIGLGWSRKFGQLSGYLKLNYDFTSAFKVEYLSGKTFNSATITAGCYF